MLKAILTVTLLFTTIVFSQSFTTTVIDSLADGAYSVYALDMEGDGDVSALSATLNSEKNVWY